MSGGTYGPRPFASLPVSRAGDPAEREADSLANAVLQRSVPSSAASPTRADAETPAPMALFGRAGRPPDQTERAHFEPRFGHDFSQVRIHADEHDAYVACCLGARAFTVGNHIAFGAGQYPAPDGQRLLAHELAHVVQQSAEPSRQVVRRQLLRTGDAPSAEAPGLSQAAVNAANAHLRVGEWQQAIDVIVDEAVRQGQIDRSKLYRGRVHYQPPVGPDPVEEGLTTGKGFRRNRTTGELTPLAMPVVVGSKAFRWGLPWLYSSILHEYKHVIQMQTATVLPTIGSDVPSQKSNSVIDPQQDVETYAEEIARAHDTGIDKHPAAIRELWKRLHTDNWMILSRADRAPIKETYRRAHATAVAIPGVGPLPYLPLP